jgi:hypothetical protein
LRGERRRGGGRKWHTCSSVGSPESGRIQPRASGERRPSFLSWPFLKKFLHFGSASKPLGTYLYWALTVHFVVYELLYACFSSIINGMHQMQSSIVVALLSLILSMFLRSPFLLGCHSQDERCLNRRHRQGSDNSRVHQSSIISNQTYITQN